MWLDDEKVEVGVEWKQKLEQEVEKLRQLKFEMDSAESVFNAARHAYADYVQHFTSSLTANGLSSLTTSDGSIIEVVDKVRCSVKKEKMRELCEWLRGRGMGNMVSSHLEVPASFSTILDEKGVPFDEKVDVNTNSVKAYVKGELERGELEEVPDMLSWYAYSEVVVK